MGDEPTIMAKSAKQRRQEAEMTRFCSQLQRSNYIQRLHMYVCIVSVLGMTPVFTDPIFYVK